MSPRAAGGRVSALVDATPPTRARDVDFLRLASIGVVVLWHWALSLNHFRDGRLVMPNPIDDVPYAWLATWLLQVMPVFFIVGGFANLMAWDGLGRAHPTWSWRRRAGGFLRVRLRRLLLPAGVFAAVWAVVDGALLLTVPAYTGLPHYGRAVLVPLWFLGAYLWAVLLVPATAAAHRRFGVRCVAVLAAAVALTDVARFTAGLRGAAYVNTALVWIFVHQLGYLWRDARQDRAAPGWGPALTAAAGLAGLLLVAALDVYPRSMVATQGSKVSNMFPTTAGIAALAVFQLGLLRLAGPALNRALARRRLWTVVVAGNAVIMTVFLWHMTALLLAMATTRWLRWLPTADEPTAAWWAQRPLWVVVPALFLIPLVALFAPVERRAAGVRPASSCQPRT